MASHKLLLHLSALAVLALVAAGCASAPTEPIVGIVGSADSTGTTVGSPAPDASFLDRRGTPRRLSAVYEDATVMAFTRSLCTRPDPRLAGLAGGSAPNVAVIQVCLCNGACCQDHDQCLQTMADRAKHMIVICDPQEELRRRYSVGEASEVFVVGRRGRVMAKAGLQELPAMIHLASELAHQARQERDALYGG